MAHNSDAPQFDPAEEHHVSSFPNVWEMAWRHKLLLVMGLVVGLVLGALYCAQLIPEYQSSTKILVVKKRPDALPIPGSTDPRLSYMEDYMATHQVLIRSPLVVGEAVQHGKLQTLPSFAGADPTGEIIRALSVSREATEGGAANIFNISFRSHVPEDCAPVLTAVVDSYKSFLEVTYHNVSQDTFKLITQAMDVLQNGLTKKEKDYRDFRLDHPVLWKGKDGLTVWQDRLFNLEAKRSASQVRQVEIEEQLAAIENAMKAGEGRDKVLALISEPAAMQSREGGKVSAAGDESLAALLLQEESLLEDFGRDHPQVRSLRKRIDRIRSSASRLPKEVDVPVDPVQAHIQLLKRELENIKTSERTVAKLLQNEQAEAQKLLVHEIKDDTFRKDIAREQQLFESVVKRLQEINLLKDLGGYDIRCIAPAGAAWKVGQKTVPVFVVAGLMGLFGGLGLAFLAEISDKSFRTPEDVRLRLGLPIMGQIPFLHKKDMEAVKPGEAGAPRIARTLCTFHSPKSREAEAYRGVRTGLFYSTQGKGHKVIQITSPSMGDGKSTLAANLAISIAQAEKKVILIDADFRRPTVHHLFGLSPKRGLGSVIGGDAELAEVILPSGIPGLSILPCGPIPPNPAELLSLPRFKELLDYIREQFDFVIVDTPPLLAVTDPCMVVPLVDGVVLTLRISKQNRPAAQRAKEILATLAATVVGVVVNAVNHHGQGYGYGYGYGYYGYGYGYGGDYYHKTEVEPAPATEDSEP